MPHGQRVRGLTKNTWKKRSGKGDVDCGQQDTGTAGGR